jgi:hypothetical protein
MPRLVYWSAVGLLLIAAAFLLTHELVKPPPGLGARLEKVCDRMLEIQLRVQAGTKAIAQGNVARVWEALPLAFEQARIVGEANRAIEMLEAEGSAVAFHEVFIQVRDDMQQVQRRLAVGDVGKVTQALEDDIVDTLQEMTKALRKPVCILVNSR